MRRPLLTTAIGYAVGSLVLAIYGVVVCPVMAGLEPPAVAGAIALGGMVALAIEAIDRRRRPNIEPAARWSLQWHVWIVPALAVSVAEVLRAILDPAGFAAAVQMDAAWVTFPNVAGKIFESTVKMALGAHAFGFFVSCYACLDEEHEWLTTRVSANEDVRPGRYLSIAYRILGFTLRATILMGLVAIILSGMHGDSLFRIFTDSVPRAIGVTMVMLAAALWLVTRLYRRNFNLLFQKEMEALEAVRMGKYDVRVPLVSQDEFRKIAEGTNEMIAGLREREAMRDRFGKHFSPEVMEAILRSDRLGGETKHVTVFFTDLRNYTALSEKMPANDVVAILNEYFTIVVDAVYRNKGVLDKFIGDAAMAYFGFSDPEGSCAAAVRTALEIRDEMKVLNAKLKARGFPSVDNGIGIHYGPVIAGTIGAQSRREFTIIGDTVNVASRLESLTKTIEVSICCSAETYAKIGDLQRHLDFLGEHEVKGKAEKLKVYGLPRTTGSFKVAPAVKA